MTLHQFLLLSLTAATVGFSGCKTTKPHTAAPKLTKMPDGLRLTAVFDVKQEFMVNVMPRSDGRAYHPTFLQINEDSDNFSASNAEELIRRHRQVMPKEGHGILVKSDHYLVQWDARDRKEARGTVLQERQFSPEWKTYREEERVFLDRLIRTAANQHVKVWINMEMGWLKGKWRLMTPPFDLDSPVDAEALRKKKAEIEPELTRLFSEAKKAGNLPGIQPDSHGKAEFNLPGGLESLDNYPLAGDLKVQLKGSEDLLEYRYVQAAHGAKWQLQSAWRVHGQGKRTRLALPKP